jgi:hypothetical protein
VEYEPHEPGASADDREVTPDQPLDDYVGSIRRGQAEQAASREALTDQLEREVLAAQVDVAARTINLLRQQGIPGQRVDVFTASDGDLVGERVLDAIYDRLGIRGARADASAEEVVADSGQQIGSEFLILDSPDLRVSELQLDGRMSHGSYRTLQVERQSG